MLAKRQRFLAAAVILPALAVVVAVLFTILTPKAEESAGNGRNEIALETVKFKETDHLETVVMDAAAQQQGTLVLVNNENLWPFPEELSLTSLFSEMSTSYSVRSSDITVSPAMLESLNEMMDAFQAATGKSDLNVISGFRSREEQQQLYDSSVAELGEAHTKRFTAMAGGSEHHTGLAIDLQICRGGICETFTGEGVYGWLYDHCAEYGFVRRYTAEKEPYTLIGSESWHFRYVGEPHAALMTEQNLCLEEYLTLLQKYPWDGEHLQAEDCEIYYCPGDTIYIEPGADYTVSGLNKTGYVVTVWQN